MQLRDYRINQSNVIHVCSTCHLTQLTRPSPICDCASTSATLPATALSSNIQLHTFCQKLEQKDQIYLWKSESIESPADQHHCKSDPGDYDLKIEWKTTPFC